MKEAEVDASGEIASSLGARVWPPLRPSSRLAAELFLPPWVTYWNFPLAQDVQERLTDWVWAPHLHNSSIAIDVISFLLEQLLSWMFPANMNHGRCHAGMTQLLCNLLVVMSAARLRCAMQK